jgi:cytochrome c
MKALAIFPIVAAALTLSVSAQGAADASKGQAAFQQQCGICHKAGTNALGPDLKGIYGSKAGAVPGFHFSPAMKQAAEKGIVWNEENLNKFLKKPQGLIPGTSMAFLGMPNSNERADVIAYLKTLNS